MTFLSVPYKQRLLLLGTSAVFVFCVGINVYGQAVWPAQADNMSAAERLADLDSQRAAAINAVVQTASSAGKDDEGRPILDTASAQKIAAIEAAYTQKSDAATARSASARQTALDHIASFPGKSNRSVTYAYTAASAYKDGGKVELYESADSYYAIDPETNAITGYGPIVRADAAVQALSTNERYSLDQLKAMAASIAEGQGVDVSGLSFKLSHKEMVYFFRWEDSSRQLNDGKGLHPFIQFAYTRNGDLLTFSNTLGL